MKLAIITAHAGAECAMHCLSSWGEPVLIVPGHEGMIPAYQQGFEQSNADVLMFVHDDVLCKEFGWKARVLREFEDPRVGLVGFGGALGHGSADLYKAPYDYHQLGRSHYMSNVDDAEVHGERFTGARDVAVLDGFSLIVRREILAHSKFAGWPLTTPIGYVGYDYWLCCETRRQGYRIRVLGCRVHHLGGRTFVKKNLSCTTDEFLAAHKYIADEYKDVLPWSCQ